jgi:hypothetical protein
MKTTFGVAIQCAVALIAGAMMLVPVAAASPDGQFLDEITTINATLPGKTPDQMVAAGYAACADLRNGTSVLDEMSAVERRYHFNQGTSFVSAATTNLCPDFASGRQPHN